MEDLPYGKGFSAFSHVLVAGLLLVNSVLIGGAELFSGSEP
jgi:hypothetical protein